MKCNKKLLMFHIAIIFKQDNHTEMRRYFDLKLTQTVTTIDGIGAIAIHLQTASLHSNFSLNLQKGFDNKKSYQRDL